MNIKLSTPWGMADDTYEVAPGILSVHTPSHGGYMLTVPMPAHFKGLRHGEYRCYEEDCQWAMPVLVYEAEFRAYALKNGHDPDKFLTDAEAALRQWFPDAWEAHYKRELKPGESMKRDEANFYRDHKTSMIVVSAWGSWHPQVPKGQVGVYALRGGRDGTGESGYFLVPEAEYQTRGRPGFVIDEAKHQRTEAFS